MKIGCKLVFSPSKGFFVFLTNVNNYRVKSMKSF